MHRLTACSLDLTRERVLRGDEIVTLTTREARLLAYLAARPGQDVSRDELLTEVWGYSSRALSRAVDATVLRVRAKIERDPTQPDHLHTAWGKGYRWVPATPADAPIGRAGEIAAIEAALDAGARLVTVTGPSGMGKTTVARHLAARRGATLLEDPTVESLEAWRGGEAGAEREVVIDGVDPEQSALVAVIARLPRVICTAREPLAIGGERVVELSPLSSADGVRVLRDRAADPRWTDTRLLAAIADELDGLPLALELAAGLAPLLCPQAMIAKLDRPLSLLVSGRRDVPERHRSLAAAVERTLDGCVDADLAVLRQAAVFSGGFTVHDLLGTLGDAVPGALAVLARLRSKGLIRPVPGTGDRLSVPRVVRAWASDGGGPALEWAREAHRRWFVAASRRMSTRGRPPAGADIAYLEADAANFLAAGRASLAVNAVDAAEVALAVFHALTRSGPVSGALDLIEACLATELPPALQGHLYRRRGDCYCLLGRREAAAESAARSVAIAVETGDRALEGLARGLAAVITLRLGNVDDSVAEFERALAIIRERGDRAAEGNLLGNYATALWTTDRLDRVAEVYERAVLLHRESGNERSAAIMLANLGLHDIDRGCFERSRARLEEALAIQIGLHDRVQQGITRGHLANLLLVEGDVPAAIAAAEEAIAILVEAGEAGNRPHVHLGLGIAAWVAGDPGRARRELETAIGMMPLLTQGFAGAALLDLVLRIDAGEIADPIGEIGRLPAPMPWLRSRTFHRLAQGFLAVQHDLARARAALVPLSEHPLAMSVGPFRRELGRRIAAFGR